MPRLRHTILGFVLLACVGLGASIVLALLGGVAAAAPGDRVQRYPAVACSDCSVMNLHPDVVADAAGNALIVWNRWVGCGYGICPAGTQGRWFGPDGRPRGTQFRVGSIFTSIAMRPDGWFVATWSTSDDVVALLFDSTGTPRGDPILVSGYELKETGTRVAIDDDGDFIVVWPSFDYTQGWIVRARAYGPTGAPKGPAFTVDSSPPLAALHVAMDAVGNFVVVWVQGESEKPSTVFARRYNAAGVARGGRFVVASPTNGPGYPTRDAAVAMADDGRFTVAFRRIQGAADDPSAAIFARRFAANGALLGGEFRASAYEPANYAHDVDVAMDPDGDFVLSWNKETPDGTASLHTRLYAASGAPLTPDLSHRVFNGDRLPSRQNVAMDGAGNFVATWTRYSYDPDDIPSYMIIFAQHFAGPHDKRAGCARYIANRVGTPGNDSLQGSAAADVIHGLGGSDVLKGGGGADIICGGAGADQLFGEEGNDHLLGGAGDDVLDGGIDRDVCNGGWQTNADTALACESVLNVP